MVGKRRKDDSEKLTVDSTTEEVRLAMAWNGGVSLAVWMGGAAIELDCARRAHLGPERLPQTVPRFVYNGLSLAFKRILVMDIIAGASAGGVNGALLAAVISRGRRLDAAFLRGKWLELGDFLRLLQPSNQPKPPSIMQGELFLKTMQSAFRVVLGTTQNAQEELDARRADAPGVEPADVLLDVQATNVLGVQRGFLDAWGQSMYAMEFRAPLRFRSSTDYSWEALATAARASASFPAAFEPMPIEGVSARLAGFEGKTRYAIDGGVLENAPIRPAIELIPTRPAERAVKRFVCYVNAAPALEKTSTEPPDAPSLSDVLGYVVNLPRDGRFVDQLEAIEDAARRAMTASDTQAGLLELETTTLRTVAKALLPAYRRRRALASLEEIVAEPGQPPESATARAIFERLEQDLRLPWLPDTLDAPKRASDWRWGFNTARRILHLELDLLRKAFLSGLASEEIYEQRKPIDAQLAELRQLAEAFASKKSIRDATRELRSEEDLDAQLNALECATEDSRIKIVAALREATRAFHDIVVSLPAPPATPSPELAIPSPELLFGHGRNERFDDAAFAAFLERVLAVEVLRRAFASDREIDSAQRLFFAQLTPFAPCPVLTDQPFSAKGPASPEQKLTGLRLAHFAAFYRRSWRVNDFMWGRLDAAARIADLLVSAERAQTVATSAHRPPELIAELLLSLGDGEVASDHHMLLEEALKDAASASQLRPQVREAAALEGSLRERLERVLTADLVGEDRGGAGLFTRVACARAAQYEVLRQELPILAAETIEDGKQGCFTEPFALEDDGSYMPAIADLRTSTEPGNSLPERLGRDLPDEGTSALALRTISHAALVAIATLPSLGLPLSRLASPVRVPFLAVAGVTAAGWSRRLAVLSAFVAGSAFLTARLTSARSDTKAPFGALWSPAVLATLLAALAVASVVSVPAWRAARSDDPARKLKQALWAIALALTGGAVAVVFALWKLGIAEGITASGSLKPPPRLLTGLMLAIAVSIPAVIRRLPLPAVVRGPLGRRVERADLTGGVTALVVIVISGAAAWWSIGPLWDALRDGGWRRAAVIFSALSILVAPAYIFWSHWRRTLAERIAARTSS